MDNFWGNMLTSSLAVATFFILLLVFYYVYSYLGLKKRREYLKSFHEKLKPGIKVLFAGGIVGKIVKIEDEFITLEVSAGNNIEVSRYGIQEILP